MPADLAGADAVILAVRDEAIAQVAARLPPAPGSAVLHCSGAYSAAELLGAVATRFGAIGRLHPLLSIVAGADFRGVVFAVEGAAARAIAERLGGRPVDVPPERAALYHAAAALAAGHLVALLDVAIELAAAAGLDSDAARHGLCALARSALDNLEAHGPAGALTGPFARGDAAVVARHLTALPEDVRGIYLALGHRALALGGAREPDRARLAALLRDAFPAMVRPHFREEK